MSHRSSNPAGRLPMFKQKGSALQGDVSARHSYSYRYNAPLVWRIRWLLKAPCIHQPFRSMSTRPSTISTNLLRLCRRVVKLYFLERKCIINTTEMASSSVHVTQWTCPLITCMFSRSRFKVPEERFLIFFMEEATWILCIHFTQVNQDPSSFLVLNYDFYFLNHVYLSVYSVELPPAEALRH